MPNIGPVELIVILAVALLVLGPKKLPEVGKSLGRGIREFKDGITSSDAHADEPEFPRERQVTAQVPVAPQPVDTVAASHSDVTSDR